MIVLLFVAAVACRADTDLPDIDLTIGGFRTFLQSEGVFYPRAEMPMRISLYRTTAKQVMRHNANPGRTYDMGMNQFSTMTEDEKSQYLGLANETLFEEQKAVLQAPLLSGVAIAESVDHTKGGLVNSVKNQGSCGSCWAFAATASFEGVNAAVTWKRKTFADQELLDCTYESDSQKDGCHGGWMYKAWDYIKNSKHFSLNRDVGYFAKDRVCEYTGKPSNINNVRVTGYTRLRGDDNLMKSIWVSVPAIAIIVESDFHSYRSGIFNGCPHYTDINHAVTAVGYDRYSWKVRNSWGEGWGESGYIRMTRARANLCRISDYVMYPNMEVDGPFYMIKNVVTGRYLSLKPEAWEDIRDKRGKEGRVTQWAWATDRNNNMDATWKIVNLRFGFFLIEHFHSGRYVTCYGNPIQENYSENGWLSAPHIAAGDVKSFEGRTVWKKKANGPAGSFFIINAKTNRLLFAAGSVVTGKPTNDGDVKVVGADSNYYGFARWEIVKADAMGRMIPSS